MFVHRKKRRLCKRTNNRTKETRRKTNQTKINKQPQQKKATTHLKFQDAIYVILPYFTKQVSHEKKWGKKSRTIGKMYQKSEDCSV